MQVTLTVKVGRQTIVLDRLQTEHMPSTLADRLENGVQNVEAAETALHFAKGDLADIARDVFKK